MCECGHVGVGASQFAPAVSFEISIRFASLPCGHVHMCVRMCIKQLQLHVAMRTCEHVGMWTFGQVDLSVYVNVCECACECVLRVSFRFVFRCACVCMHVHACA